jgi:hypothetical protein
MRAYNTADSGAPLAERQIASKQTKKAAKKASKAKKKRANAKAKAKNKELAEKRAVLQGLKLKKKGGGSRLFGSLVSGFGKICKKMIPVKITRSATDSQLKVSHGRRFSQLGSGARLLGSATELKLPRKRERRKTAGVLASYEANGTGGDIPDGSPVDHPGKLKSSSRSSSEPVLVKMVSSNVNRFKACPLSLGEKLARWCRASPMAIFRGHPPEDHFVQFPGFEYSDLLAERRAELAAAGHVCELGYDPIDRDECVLERYPDGRHGLTPFDMTLRPPVNPDALKSPKLPAPQFPTESSRDELSAKKRASRPQLRMGQSAGTTESDVSAPPAPVRAARKHTPPMLRRGSADSVVAAQGTCLNLTPRLGSSWDLSGIPAHIPEELEEIAEAP